MYDYIFREKFGIRVFKEECKRYAVYLNSATDRFPLGYAYPLGAFWAFVPFGHSSSLSDVYIDFTRHGAINQFCKFY